MDEKERNKKMMYGETVVMPKRAQWTGSISYDCERCNSEVYLEFDLWGADEVKDELEELDGKCTECAGVERRDAHICAKADAENHDAACGVGGRVA